MNLEDKIQFYLSEEAYAIVQSVGKLSSNLDKPVYLVGGAVRDILLGRQSVDLDFVTEGSGIKLAETVCQELGGELTTHDRFGTAVWTPPADLFSETVDFITARTEIYPSPASLPQVTPSSIQDDLFRRDFAINAMAVRLDQPHFGQLLDPYKGTLDLDQKKIQILHDQSFDDDPTRMFRAARYAGRLGFELTQATRSALQQSRPNLAHLSADRVRHELEKLLGERFPTPMLELLQQWQVFESLPANLTLTDLQRIALTRLDGCLSIDPGRTAAQNSSIEELRLAIWLLHTQLLDTSAVDVADELNCTADFKRDLERVLNVIQQGLKMDDFRPGTVEKLLRGFTATQLLLLQAHQATPAALKVQIPTYFNTWRLIKTTADGNTLRQIGVRPGPIYQKILDQLLADKLNGEFESDAAESERLTQLIDQLGPQNKKDAS